jgi:UDP-glucose 4-epimerase
MKILVTGGAGFIGSNVVDAYIREGHEVVVVDNLSTGLRENLNPKATFHEVDICDAAFADVFAREKPQAVAHLAAQIDVRRSVQEPTFDARVNILGSINVLEACVKHGADKIIFASTGGAVYGEPDPAALPLTEECPPRPACHYGTSKLSVEHYIDLYSILYGLRYTILRFPNVYGPRQNPHGEAGVCAILVGLMLAGKTPTLFGFGEPLRDYVYVGDIARGCVLALDKADGQILNLGSGKGTSVREIFDELKRVIGFEGEPVLEPLRPGEIQKTYITGDKARELLGWKPEVDLAEGLKRTLEHVRSQVASAKA